MRARAFYRDRTDYSREVTEYLMDFEHRTGKQIERVDPDTREGQELVDLYDLNRQPAILVTADDGRMLYRHLGMPMPLQRDIELWMERG